MQSTLLRCYGHHPTDGYEGEVRHVVQQQAGNAVRT